MRHWLFVLLAVLPLAAPAQSSRFDQEYDEENRPWVEIQAQLPAYPKPENLIQFQVSPADPNRYFVDAESISVGSDGVVRYTMVIRASGGAENVIFEGIRCGYRERKLYAFGHRDGTWSRARSSAWKWISDSRQDMRQRVLYYDFFCPDKSIVKTGEEAIAALRTGIHPAAKDAQVRGGSK